jgi:hypothetical protein
MKIRIKTGDWRQFEEFSITGIHYELDEHNCPVDIVIYGTEDVLDELSQYAILGYNSRPLNDCFSEEIRMEALGATHTCLCARLPEFTVHGALRVIYQ